MHGFFEYYGVIEVIVEQRGLLVNIIQNVAVIGLLAYLLTRLPAARRTLYELKYSQRDRLLLMLGFGLFSALGNWLGIPVMGSMANTRIVGPIAGGLIGGPLVGIGAGIIGAIPRYFMGGFTMWHSVSANVIAGVVSGLVYQKLGPQRINLKVALLTGLVCEMILKGLILAFAKPFEQAWELERIIGIPTIIANSLAVGLFVYITKDVFGEQAKIRQKSTHQVIELLSRGSDLFKDGLNEHTAGAIAKIIYDTTGAAAVALTDTVKVLAFIGAGADHHLVGHPIITKGTQQILQDPKLLGIYNRGDIGCPYTGCPLNTGVEAALVVDGEISGTVKLYRVSKERITPYEIELIQGIATFLSLQLAQQQLQQHRSLLGKMEFNMLKAQVNPHFLFNTLGTIRALISQQPTQARILVKDLADFLRASIDRSEEVVTVQQELELVMRYFRIEKARFGDRINLIVEVAPELAEQSIPVFTLQPLIENTIKHGFAHKTSGAIIHIRAYRTDHTIIAVTDNGCGLPYFIKDRFSETAGIQCNKTEHFGIGLYNVDSRLRIIYGDRYGLTVDMQQEVGTTVYIHLP